MAKLALRNLVCFSVPGLLSFALWMAVLLIPPPLFAADLPQRPRVWSEASAQAVDMILRELETFDLRTRDNIDLIIHGVLSERGLSPQERAFWEQVREEFIVKKISKAEIKEFMDSIHASASVTGDPHFMTGDGYMYSLQTVGEFILLKATTTPFQIQARFEPYTDSVSITTAIAMRIDNATTLAFYSKPQPRVLLNHKPVMIDKALKLANGLIIQKQNTDYTISWPDGKLVIIRFYHSRIDFRIANKNIPALKPVGLLGNFNSSAQDDIAIRDGAMINVSSLSRLELQKELYGRFATSWRITQKESLFDYLAGESTAFFTNLNFPKTYNPLQNIPFEKQVAARKLCKAKGITISTILENCILDVAVTNDKAFADSAVFVTSALPKMTNPTPSENRPTEHNNHANNTADPCKALTGCEQCNARQGCGFCSSSGQCLSDANRATCEVWLGTVSSCRTCSYSTCTTCMKDAYCGWSKEGKCLNVDAMIRNRHPELVEACF